jgi:hypothetical protein
MKHWRSKMYFKKLVEKKCSLSPIDENDAEKFTEWLNDLEVTINLQIYHGVFNVENEKKFSKFIKRTKLFNNKFEK